MKQHRKYFLSIFLLSIFNSFLLFGTSIPQFKIEQIEFKIPTNIVGIAPISSPKIYSIRGQVFITNGTGRIPMASEGYQPRLTQSTPWETLADLMYYYHYKDTTNALSLFTPASLPQINTILADPVTKSNWINFVSTTTQVDILICWERGQNQLVCLAQSPEMSDVDTYIFEKIKNKWFMVAGEDDPSQQEMSNDLTLFFKQKNITNLEVKIF